MASIADQFAKDAGSTASAGSSLASQFASDLASKDAPAQAKPAERSLLQEVGRQVALTGRAGVTSLMSIPNMFGDALNTAINYGIKGVNAAAGTDIPRFQLPSNATQNLMDIAGVAQPENGRERVAQAVASSMGAVKPSVELGKLLAKSAAPAAQAVGNGLQAAQGMQILGAGGAGLGSSVAGEMGADPSVQFLAGLGGAAVGAGAGTAVSRFAGARPSATPASVPAKTDVAPPNMMKPRLKLNTDGSMQDLTQPVPSFSSPAEAVPAVRSNTPIVAESQGGAVAKLPESEQMQRIATLRALGLDEQRPSTYAGDAFQGAQEYQTSKLDTPVGRVLRDQFAKEQDALKNYASGIVESTGGVAGSDPVARGTAITTPLKGLSDHFDQQISALYQAADKAAGGAPSIQLGGLSDLLKTNSVFAGKAENSALRRGVNAYLKEQGIITQDGLQPVTAQQAEGVRQYLNSQWSPQNSGLIGRIKEALDFDVTKAAGDDVYKEARQLHAARKNTLDNPKGIASILQEDGPNGINRQVPVEQVASRTINMPAAQFGHVVDTLKNMPTPELQEQANQAINEIRRQMAENIYAAGAGSGKGTWNSSAVTKALNSMRSKLSLVFSTDELNKLRILNDAGHILNTDRSYPGAAAQGYNMIQSGAIKLGPSVGTAVGAVAGSPAAGYVAGKSASSMIQGWADKSNAAKLAEMLRQPAPK